jgi:hypothetical protein
VVVLLGREALEVALADALHKDAGQAIEK